MAGGRRARVHQPFDDKSGGGAAEGRCDHYDSLIGTEILSALPKTADYIYVGNVPDSTRCVKEEINLLLLKELKKAVLSCG